MQDFNKINEAITDLQAQIIALEALITPPPLTEKSQLVVRHLRGARESLSDAKVRLRLARAELDRPSSKKA